MEFSDFMGIMKKHVAEMGKKYPTLYTTNVDKDKLWETYLDSFPPGTNEIFRKRREFDCSCCRHFIKSFGGVVAIDKDDSITTIWDFTVDSEKYQQVVNTMGAFVRSHKVVDVFVTKDQTVGNDYTLEQCEDKTVRTWHHFHVRFPKIWVTTSSDTTPTIVGQYRDVRNVFKRSLDEISRDAIETVLDLIAQKSLYKGDEWEGALNKFLALHIEYHTILKDIERIDTDEDLDHAIGVEMMAENYCWRKSIEVGGAIGKIKNHSIGVLLTDISAGMDLDEAVRRYEKIVAPTNYKRPKAIFTKKMIEQAQEALANEGLLDSLGRRYATIDDITVNNVLWANRNAVTRMKGGDVFNELIGDIAIEPKMFSKMDEVPIEHFVKEILPRLTSIEAFVENRHAPNFVSVIAPQNKDAKSLFKWGNGFSWAYNGNITDSMKERVKAAGGNVEGILRFSLQWNEDGDNENDFDAHCKEPNGNHIWFQNKGHRHQSSGMLDVDIIHPGKNEVAVENITWTSLTRMYEGVYTFYVHNYTHRGGRSGFRAEIEYDGHIHSFDYNRELRQDEEVVVAKVHLDKNKGITLLESLPACSSSRNVWGINTNQFTPVSVMMYSPNYWDGQVGIGNCHYLFIIDGCINDTSPNGFFNEFLHEDLMKHKRVLEALGGKMRVENSDNQLSGLGFSTTKRNHLVCKIDGHVTRTIKVTF